jgi:hypothetical protein
MNKLTVCAAVFSGLLLTGPAFAQTSPTQKSAPGGAMKMTQSECDAAWKRLDTGNSGSVAQAQAQSAVSDFKTADSNSDGKLSQTEFRQACNRGLVRSSATTGSGTGSPSTPSKTK